MQSCTSCYQARRFASVCAASTLVVSLHFQPQSWKISVKSIWTHAVANCFAEEQKCTKPNDVFAAWLCFVNVCIKTCITSQPWQSLEGLDVEGSSDGNGL